MQNGGGKRRVKKNVSLGKLIRVLFSSQSFFDAIVYGTALSWVLEALFVTFHFR